MSGNVKFEWFGDKIIDKVDKKVKQTLKQAGAIVRDDARQYAPLKFGGLRASIERRFQDIDDNIIYVGTNKSYAEAQEFGTSRGIVGKHYMEKAFLENEDLVQKMLADAIGDVVGK